MTADRETQGSAPHESAAARPVQLRLGFAPPTRPLDVRLDLAGLFVYARASAGNTDAAFAYLQQAGAEPEVSPNGDVRFPVRKLPQLAALPPQVRLDPAPVLAAVVALAVHPSPQGRPAVLSHASEGLRLQWHAGADDHDEPFPLDAAPALLHAGLPFAASHAAWDALKGAVQVETALVGRVHLNEDGFLEIATTTPQLVEAAPLPGLFRVDDTHYGLALTYAREVERPGFRFDGPTPVPERGPVNLPVLPMPLSGHATADLRDLVDRLAALHAQAVVWPSGLGRRIFALAALESLDAWPALIVTPPSGVWAWQRHLDLLQRSHSLIHTHNDVHLLTYHDLGRRTDLPSPAAIIFDDLVGELERNPGSLQAIEALTGVHDVYRIATSSAWPGDLQAAVQVMSALRPQEFTADVPLVQRYPLYTRQRAAEHIAAYLSLRTADAPDTDRTRYRRSSVITVQPTEAQRNAMRDVAARLAAADAGEALSEILDIISAGTGHALSPKVAAAAARIRDAAERGRSIAVATRSRRTAKLLAAAVRPLPVRVHEAAGAVEGVGQGALIVHFDGEVPGLHGWDEVVFVDYPRTTAVIEQAVGAADTADGPERVSVIHMPGTIDDRLAMHAARHRENAAAARAQGITADEARWILRRR